MRAPGAAFGYLSLALAVLCWGAAPRALTIASEHSSALTLNALRSVIAAALLLVLVLVLRPRLPRGHVAFWVVLTGLFFTAYLQGFAEGTIRAGAGNTAVLANTAPLFVLVFGRLFLGERMPLVGVLGLLLGFTGVVVMVSSQIGGDEGSNLALGMALALGAALAAAVNILLVKWLLETDAQVDVLSVTTGQLVVAAGILVPLAFAVDGAGGGEWSAGELWGTIVFLGAGGLAVATLAFFASLRRLPATTASAALILVPVVAVLIEAGRGNPPDAVVLAGMALAVGGVALVLLRTQLRLDRPPHDPTAVLPVVDAVPPG